MREHPMITFSNEGDFRVYDNTGHVVWCLNRDGIQIKHNDCLDAVSYHPNYMGFGEHEITYDEFITQKGEFFMENKILELYDKRQREKLEKQFNAIIEEEYNNLDAVKRFNELVQTFNASLEELVHEFPNVDGEVKTFVKTGYECTFKYEISYDIKNDIKQKYRKEFEDALVEHTKEIEEIKAMLSISNDKDYQMEVLDRYGITKKGKMTI